MIWLNSCLFCFKPISVDNLERDTINPVLQFFTSFQRQVNDLASPSKLYFKNLIRQTEKNVNIWPCEACWEILDTYNKLYEQMKNMELQTMCMLDKLGNIMGEADQVPERVQWFSDQVKQLEGVNVNSTTIENLTQFRTALQQTCNIQSAKRLPIVKLERLIIEKPATISDEDMGSSGLHYNPTTDSLNALFNILKEMTSLNIVFNLALLYSDKSEDNYIANSNKNKNVIGEGETRQVKTTNSALVFNPVQNNFKCHRCHLMFPNFSSLKYHWMWCQLKNINSTENVCNNQKLVEISQEEILVVDLSPLTKLRHRNCNTSLVYENLTNQLNKHSYIQSCVVCKKVMKKTSMRKHMRNIHGQSFNMSQHQKSQVHANDVGSKQTLTRKRKKRYGVVVHKCHICPFSTFHRANVVRHLKCHTKSTYPCTLCNYPNSTAILLKRHMTCNHKKIQTDGDI